MACTLILHATIINNYLPSEALASPMDKFNSYLFPLISPTASLIPKEWEGQKCHLPQWTKNLDYKFQRTLENNILSKFDVLNEELIW